MPDQQFPTLSSRITFSELHCKDCKRYSPVRGCCVPIGRRRKASPGRLCLVDWQIAVTRSRPVGSSLLEVGCNKDRMVLITNKHSRRKLVITRSDPVWSDSVRSIERRTYNDRAQSLPFPDATFDAVVAFATIEHWGDTPAVEAGLAGCARVLKPGGVFFVDLPVNCSHGNPLGQHGTPADWMVLFDNPLWQSVHVQFRRAHLAPLVDMHVIDRVPFRHLYKPWWFLAVSATRPGYIA